MPITDKGVVYIQEGGSGQLPRFAASSKEASVAGPSGGGATFESLWAGNRYKASRQTANPERVTAQLSVREDVADELQRAIERAQCLPNAYIFRGCTPDSKSKFSKLHVLIDAAITAPGYSGNILDGMSGDTPDLLRQVTLSAGVQIVARQVAHSAITGTVSTGAFNHIIALNPDGTCAGICGTGRDGTQEFLACGDPVSPATIPRVFYTANSGTTWTQQTIAASASGAAEGIALVGDRVVVAVSGTNGGIFTAPLEGVKLGTATFALANGITAGNVYNAIIALDGSTCVAVGATGRVALSVDGGFTFTLLTTPGVIALAAVSAGANKNTVWVGGATGNVWRISGLTTVAAVTVTGLSTDAVTAIAVPFDRPNEVYIGATTGKIFRSLDADETTPTWSELTFDKPASSIIEYIAFADARQSVMAVVQSNGSSQSRVIWDRSGGNMSDFAVAVGTFTSPANSVINAIAPVSMNFALSCGEPTGGQGFLGAVNKTN